MKYNVREKVSDDIETQILASRGVKDPAVWRYNVQMNDWRLLGDIYPAVDMLALAVKHKRKICLLVDSDCDGFSSSAIMFNFLCTDLHMPTSLVAYRVHEGKQHGLADVMDVIPSDTRLLIVPDAGTSDYDFHDQLTARGCEVLILDHHQAEFKNPNPDVVTVNPQLDNYPNKSLTGAGVVWQFVRAYSELLLDCGDFDKYIDLCAFGNISDMADFREMEIRAIVRRGMSNITNPFLSSLARQNEYTLNKYGGLCYRGCAFGLTPFVNAICRSGTIEEKRTVFDAMLNTYGYALVPSGKRGAKGEMVSFADEAVRIALNVKARQTKEQNAMVDDILADNTLDNDINVVVCNTPNANPSQVGLVSNKLQDMFKRPAIVLIDYPDEKVYRGSARNCDKSPIDDFRKFCEDSGFVNFAQGHASAFGIEIAYNMLDKFIGYCNSTGYDFVNGSIKTVDFEYEYSKIDRNLFDVVDGMADCWGQQIQPVSIAVTDIPVPTCSTDLLSPDKAPTMKLTAPNGLQFLKFKSGQAEVDAVSNAGPQETMTVTGSPSMNHWNGNKYDQVLIDDYILEEKWIF